MNKRPELGNGQGRLDDRSWVVCRMEISRLLVAASLISAALLC